MRSPLTLDERLKIEDQLKLGYSASSIAILLGRGKNSIVWEIRRNGGRLKYKATTAQIEADERNKNRIEKIRVKNVYKNPKNSIFKRIENIEMQIEILTETIKEIINATKN